MVSNPRASIPLIKFANDLKKSGLFIIGHIMIGDLDHYEIDPVVEQYPLWLKLSDMLSVKAFIELTLANSVREGYHHLLRTTGLGAMKPNTVVFGFYDDQPQVDYFETDSQYACIRNSKLNDELFLKLRPSDQKNISVQDYVLLVHETVNKFKKNVCIGRHFDKFNWVLIHLLSNCFVKIRFFFVTGVDIQIQKQNHRRMANQLLQQPRPNIRPFLEVHAATGVHPANGARVEVHHQVASTSHRHLGQWQAVVVGQAQTVAHRVRCCGCRLGPIGG